jgi:hypothetical protein
VVPAEFGYPSSGEIYYGSLVSDRRNIRLHLQRSFPSLDFPILRMNPRRGTHGSQAGIGVELPQWVTGNNTSNGCRMSKTAKET